MREMEENVYKVVQYVGKAAFEEAKGCLEGLEWGVDCPGRGGGA